MDELFGSSKPAKKEKTKTTPKPQGKVQQTQLGNGTPKIQQVLADGNQPTAAQNRKERNRERKALQYKKKLEEQALLQEKVELQLPLIIKLHHSIADLEDTEKSLEDFIEFIYPQKNELNQLENDKDQIKKQKKKTKFNKLVGAFSSEDDEGSIEYKLKLIKPTEDRLDHLATQMKYRIKEGSGQCCYRIGVEDDGRAIGLGKEEMYESLRTICILASKVQADVTAFRISQGLKGNVVQLMIRKNQKQGINLEIRLLLLGEPGSGKSTLLGVIKSGEKDNGKGYARTKVFTHRDQFMSGITQSKSHHVIAFDSNGKLCNHNSMTSIENWLDNSSKVLSFIDVAGHKEKQVVSSLCSFFPEYALWVVSGENSNMSKSSLELARIFNLPLIVVISHLDRLDKTKQMEAVLRVKKILKQLYPEKTPSIVREMEHAVLFSRITSTEAVIPIFLLSSVTGQNIELLTNFFNLLTSVSELRNNQDLYSQFLISYKYLIDKKIVLAGTVIKGIIKVRQILHLGPDLKGSFRAVQVLSIECMRVPVKMAKCGQICTIGIRPISYAKQWLEKQPDAIRRGMVLIESKNNPKATYEFSASFRLYSNDATDIKITAKCQPVINTLTTRQICDIVMFPSKAEEEQAQIQSLKLMKKKKSKSIDLFQKSKHSGHHNLSHSTIKNISSMGEKSSSFSAKNEKKNFRSHHKISADFLEDEYLTDKKTLTKETQQHENLKPIKELNEEQKDLSSKLKKKKERDVEIKFSSGEPTNLRLRFKYCPEYLEKGQKLVINELKLIGKVTELFY